MHNDECVTRALLLALEARVCTTRECDIALNQYLPAVLIVVHVVRLVYL